MKLTKFMMAAAFAVLAATPALANGPEVATTTTTTTTTTMKHHGPPPPMMFFDKMDTNHDGVVTKSEWMKDAAGKFAEIDLNHDGRITKREIWAFHEKMRSQHPDWAPPPPPHDGQMVGGPADHGWSHEQRVYRHSDYYAGNRPNMGAPDCSTSTPAFNNEVDPDRRAAGADGAGGWTAQ